jgi:hypothetical protein
MSQNGLPNFSVAIGLASAIVGMILIFFSYKLVMHMLLFTLGCLMLYYGLSVLNLGGVNRAVVFVRSWIRKILP